MKKPKPIQERLNENSEYCPDTGCRIWKGRVDKNGYPEIKVDGKRVCVRPLAFSLANKGSPQSSMVARPQILMTCRNKTCINPDHMLVKSDEDRLLTALKQEIYHWGLTRARANSRYRYMITPRYIDAEARRQLEARMAANRPRTPEVQTILDQVHRRGGGSPDAQGNLNPPPEPDDAG